MKKNNATETRLAKGKKTGGRDFQVGNPGGPGTPPLPPEIKEIRRFKKADFEVITSKYLWSTQPQLIEAAQNPEIPAIEKMIITILLAAIQNADQTRAEFFLQRLIGKVTEKIEVNEYADYSTPQLIQILKLKLPEIG